MWALHAGKEETALETKEVDLVRDKRHLNLARKRRRGCSRYKRNLARKRRRGCSRYKRNLARKEEEEEETALETKEI